MADVSLSNAAADKLARLHKYISEDLHSPVAADNTVGGIFNALERLERFPASGPLLSSIHRGIPERFADTRFLVCGNYIAVYDYDETNVTVLQIYHGAEDYTRHLFREQP